MQSTLTVSAAAGLAVAVNVSFPDACALARTPHAPYSSKLAGAGLTTTALDAVTPDTLTACVYGPLPLHLDVLSDAVAVLLLAFPAMAELSVLPCRASSAQPEAVVVRLLAIRVGPAGPCGPVAPVSPFGPWGPVAPVSPFGP